MTHDARAALLVNLIDELARTRGRIASAFAEGRTEAGLSDLEMVVLNAVTGAAHPPTVPQIGRSLGHARQVIQRAATALVGQGLARWIVNPDHKRAHRLVATEAGTAIKARADARGLAVARRLTAGMDATILQQAIASLHAIRERLEDDARGADASGQDTRNGTEDATHAG
jgi:DNA-binding MarR family transcriptional regulator